MKIYVLRYYDYEEQNIIGIYNNVEDVAQAVEKIVADNLRAYWAFHNRKEALERYGVEVYDLNTTYEHEPDPMDADEFIQNYHE